MADPRPETIFIDIDGVVLYHHGSLEKQMTMEASVLKGVKEKFDEWDRKGCSIILTTGRRECFRSGTVAQLSELGIIYDFIIMGCGGGRRVIINDKKPDGEVTALAFSPDRNKGLGNVNF